ncbi:peptidoglycan-binding domain-containing protein [Crenalkalicoccus roseus]|uniref:peptidoglycan-binding domain-containing protein n=1 Tax=Crenalkalicoccus roseus TaxID=1485588 RepID=UPI001081B649|nr:peptidoglycan-binding domain-containing protein [Crenalkalicoccus roseus]
MNSKLKLLGVAGLVLAVGACGTAQPDRTTGGAAAGAATGAGIGALAGPPGVLAGAAIGAGAGAVTGAATDPRTVNLGDPPWRDPQVRVPGVAEGPQRGAQGQRAADARAGQAGMSRGEVRDLQRALNDRGYQAGPVDGIWGPRTRSALMEFQRAQGMEPTGRVDSNVRQALNLGTGRQGGMQPRDDRDRAYMGGGMVGTGGEAGMGAGAGGGMVGQQPGMMGQDRMNAQPGMQNRMDQPGTDRGPGVRQDTGTTAR